jgi:hypothetical protein
VRALALDDREATVEIEGVREVLRPGSRLLSHTVKSVSPARIVLVLTAAPSVGEPKGWGQAPLVILTFDETGESKATVFWTSDPTARSEAEAKRP